MGMRHSGAENRNRIGTFSLEERCAAVKHYPRKLWYSRKDLNLDHALIGRGSCHWTTEVNLLPEDGLNHRLPLCRRGTLRQTELLGQNFFGGRQWNRTIYLDFRRVAL